MRIFEIAIDAGIDITDAVTRFSGGTPMPMYALSTEPAMVEKPAAPRVSVRDGGREEREEGKGLTGRHGEVELGLGHVVDVGLDETRGLALADEGRGGGDDGLCARDVHDLEEEPGEAADEPLHDAEVVHHLHEGDEEDDGRELRAAA